MRQISDSQPMNTAQLDRTLEYAVVHCWDELMPATTAGSIHIDYETGPDGSLDVLKVQSSTLWGVWNLICEVWTRQLWAHEAGTRFGPGYEPAEFARILGVLVERQNAFTKLPERHGLIHISYPTEQERADADRWMKVAFAQIVLPPAPLLA